MRKDKNVLLQIVVQIIRHLYANYPNKQTAGLVQTNYSTHLIQPHIQQNIGPIHGSNL